MLPRFLVNSLDNCSPSIASSTLTSHPIKIPPFRCLSDLIPTFPMASHVIPANTTLSQITPQTAGQKPATPVIAGWFSRRGVPLRRRRKVPTVRLGGKKTRRGYFLVRLLRRVRVRWLRLKNSCMLKKLKDYYHSLVQDLIDGGGTMESFQQRLFLETSFGVPVMGLTFNTFPNAGSSLHG